MRGGFHERLEQDGTPIAEPRRSRVKPRQAYCFAMAPSLGWNGRCRGARDAGPRLLPEEYHRPDGLFRTLVAPDGSVLDDQRGDLRPGVRAAGVRREPQVLGTGAASATAKRGICCMTMQKTMKGPGWGFENGMPHGTTARNRIRTCICSKRVSPGSRSMTAWSGTSSRITSARSRFALHRRQRRAARVLRHALGVRGRASTGASSSPAINTSGPGCCCAGRARSATA